jgi:hypothetical protein
MRFVLKALGEKTVMVLPACCWSVIAGLGGRDITVQLLEEIYFDVKGSDTPRKESIWVGLQEVNRAT